MSKTRVVLACFLCTLFAGAVMAQSDVGSIGGFVRDPSGAVVPKAKVVVKNEGTREEHSTSTNDSGYYTVTNLPPSLYTVTVEGAGFKKFESTHNKLDPNSALSLDASLTVGAATETVEVSATAAVLQTESAAVEDQVTGQQVNMQELNGRNPIYIAQLIPGMISGSTMGDFNFSVGAGNPFYVNGARQQDTLVTIDGAPALRTRANGAVIGVANVDATEEVQVLTADYAAEYGRAAGGQIRMVSKSGTSDFHGSLYEYLRNSDMNANTWTRNQSTLTNFAQPIGVQQFRRYGRRPHVGSRVEPEAPPEALLLRGVGLDPVPLPRLQHHGRADSPDAPGEFQRTARLKSLLLGQPRDLRSLDLPFNGRSELLSLSRVTSSPPTGKATMAWPS